MLDIQNSIHEPSKNGQSKELVQIQELNGLNVLGEHQVFWFWKISERVSNLLM
jgi:hypothetical protein